MKKYLFLFSLLLATTTFAQHKRILFIMSAARELPLHNGKTYANTGVFLSEFYLAWHDLRADGYVIEFATPAGRVAQIDKESFQKKYWKGRDTLIAKATAFVQNDSAFNHPQPLEAAAARIDGYAGMIIPGGQGLMVDLINDTLTRSIIRAFAARNKCVGLICHAPALLTRFTPEENPFQGYRVNSVTGLEEFFIERFVMKGRPLNRKIGRQLKRTGFVYVKGGPGKNFAVRDRNLVTSQNPFSNEAFMKCFRAALAEERVLP